MERSGGGALAGNRAVGSLELIARCRLGKLPSQLLCLCDPSVAGDAPLEIEAAFQRLDLGRLEIGDLPEMEDALFVEAALQRRPDAGNGFQIIGPVGARQAERVSLRALGCSSTGRGERAGLRPGSPLRCQSAESMKSVMRGWISARKREPLKTP